MIEILNPDFTPFDNLIPDFQAGEDSPPIPFAILRARHVIAWALTTAVVLCPEMNVVKRNIPLPPTGPTGRQPPAQD